jgi:hypothetical protein
MNFNVINPLYWAGKMIDKRIQHYGKGVGIYGIQAMNKHYHISIVKKHQSFIDSVNRVMPYITFGV